VRDDAASPQTTAHIVVAPPSNVGQRVAPITSRVSWRGIILDLTVVAANLFLVVPLARLLRAGGQAFLATGQNDDARVSPAVSWLFLSVFAAHAFGAFLKRLPRQARLAARQSGETEARCDAGASDADDIAASERRRKRRQLTPRLPTTNKLLVFVACALLLFHFAIFLLLLDSGWQGTGLDNWVSVFGKSSGADASPFFAFLVRFVLIVFILPAPTFLAALASVGVGDAPPASWRTHWLTELCADLLLYFSIVVITIVMNVVVAPRFALVAGEGERTSGDMLASLIPLALAFSIIYLPPRFIYLAEDYRVPATWLTILLALLTLAYRTFFPAAFTW
jgi:hypothetical protein